MTPLYIVWSEDYDSGVKILDEQHRGLVSIINSFFFHKSEADEDIHLFLVPTSEMFKNHVKINYLTLKQLLLESRYEKMKEFCDMYLKIINSINRVNMDQRRVGDPDGLLAFLKSYWIDYAKRTDLEYIRHIKNYYGNRA